MPAAWELVKILPPEMVIKTELKPEAAKVQVPVLSTDPVGVFPSLSLAGAGNPLQNLKQKEKFLAILVPHTGGVNMEWAWKFRSLPLPAGTHILMSKGQPIDITRDVMARQLVKEGYEWLFFLDSDVIVPPDVFTKLFSHKKPIVAGLYRARQHGGFVWAAWMRVKMPVGSEKTEAFSSIERWEGRLIPCDVTGSGCLLVHRSVFEKIREKFPNLPWFFWGSNRNKELMDLLGLPDPLMREVSEDFWFCLLAKQCGFEILLDTDVKCGHLSTVKIVEGGIILPEA